MSKLVYCTQCAVLSWSISVVLYPVNSVASRYDMAHDVDLSLPFSSPSHKIEHFCQEAGEECRVAVMPSLRDAHHAMIFPQVNGLHGPDPWKLLQYVATVHCYSSLLQYIATVHCYSPLLQYVATVPTSLSIVGCSCACAALVWPVSFLWIKS